MAKQPDNGILGNIPLDTRTALEAGKFATGIMGKGGNPAAAGLEVVTTGMDIDNYTQTAASIMGENDVRHLTVDSKAFKEYVNSLSGLYEERLVNLGVGIAGGAAATGLAALAFGPPGWIAGIGITAAGGILASFLKETVAPSRNHLFVDFARELQSQGQQKSLPPEAAYVALVMNMSDAAAMRNIIKNFPPEAEIHNINDMVKALSSDEGRMYLTQSMNDNDFLVRASTGAITATPGLSLSEEFAATINNGHMAGVDLLSMEKTMQVGTMLNMAAMQRQQPMLSSNPNGHLPTRKNSISRD